MSAPLGSPTDNTGTDTGTTVTSGDLTGVDIATLPPLLPSSVKRVQPDGRPTTDTINNEFDTQQWYLTNATNLNQKLTDVKAQTANSLADINTQITAQATSTEALASEVTTLTATVNTNNTTITQTLQSYANTTSAQGQAITDLQSTVAGNAAQAHNELLSYVGPNGSTAQSITSLQTTVGSNTSAISTTQQSINGISARMSLQLTLNNQTGGYTVTGAQKTDGTGSVFSVAFQANQFSLTDSSYNGGNPGNVFSYSGGYFTFGVPVLVTNGNLQNAAATQATSATSSTPSGVSTQLSIRGTGFVPIWVSYAGATANMPGTPSTIYLVATLDGSPVGYWNLSTGTADNGSGPETSVWGTNAMFVLNSPAAGIHTFGAYISGTVGGAPVSTGGLTILVQELSK